jgi:hypothetical protein
VGWGEGRSRSSGAARAPVEMVCGNVPFPPIRTISLSLSEWPGTSTGSTPAAPRLVSAHNVMGWEVGRRPNTPSFHSRCVPAWLLRFFHSCCAYYIVHRMASVSAATPQCSPPLSAGPVKCMTPRVDSTVARWRAGEGWDAGFLVDQAHHELQPGLCFSINGN